MSSKIEKKDLKTIYRRYLALNSMNDYPGQMHNGYTFSLLPVLDKIYKDNKEERIKAGLKADNATLTDIVSTEMELSAKSIQSLMIQLSIQ